MTSRFHCSTMAGLPAMMASSHPAREFPAKLAGYQRAPPSLLDPLRLLLARRFADTAAIAIMRRSPTECARQPDPPTLLPPLLAQPLRRSGRRPCMTLSSPVQSPYWRAANWSPPSRRRRQWAQTWTRAGRGRTASRTCCHLVVRSSAGYGAPSSLYLALDSALFLLQTEHATSGQGCQSVKQKTILSRLPLRRHSTGPSQHIYCNIQYEYISS